MAAATQGYQEHSQLLFTLLPGETVRKVLDALVA
jgi:hypothetical protein